MQEFGTSKDYLGGLSIRFVGDPSRLEDPAEQLRACSGLLHKLKTELESHITKHIGTRTFKPKQIKAVFVDKTLNFDANSANVKYSDSDYDRIVNAADWFAFDGAFYGTGEERGLVKLLGDWWHEAQNIYQTFYLIRNEKHIPIYNFNDGKKFYPDYVMFLKKRNGETLTYEIFVEPKGTHLQKIDQWKEDFLKEIQTKCDTQVIAENLKYRILGVGRFYNQTTENEFREELNQTLQQTTETS